MTTTLPETRGINSTQVAYLREIRKFPLLREKERTLVTLTSRGIRARNLKRSLREGKYNKSQAFWRLKAEEIIERALSPEALEEEKTAKEKLINHNLRLVVSIVTKEFLRFRTPTVSIIDLISWGNEGLMTAAKNYWKRKYKFSTYATWWIKQSVRRAWVNEARPIRLPPHISELLWRYWRVQSKMALEEMRDPSFEEVLERMGENGGIITPKQARILTNIIHQQNIASLNAPRDLESDDLFLSDIISSDEPENNTEEIAIQSLEKEELQRIMSKVLTDRERAIIFRRFGLSPDGREETLEAIGKTYGVTRERVRQIEARALQKLKRNRKVRQWFFASKTK